MIKINNLIDISKTIASEHFEGKTYPWEALDGINELIFKIGSGLSEEEFDHPEEGVWIAKDATVYPSAYIKAPCIIDKGAEVRIYFCHHRRIIF